eukprot:4049890-Prymnesium_polylepis.1
MRAQPRRRLHCRHRSRRTCTRAGVGPGGRSVPARMCPWPDAGIRYQSSLQESGRPGREPCHPARLRAREPH